MRVERNPKKAEILPAKFYEIQAIEGARDLLSKHNQQYSYWSKIKHIELPSGVTPHDFWCTLKAIRRSNHQFIHTTIQHFTYWITPQIQNSLHQLDLHCGGNLTSSSILTDNDHGRYLISSLMEEAISSSILEGAVTTRKAAKDMLRKNRKPASKSDTMVLNNYKAMNYIREKKDDPLDLDTLLTLHRILTTATLKKDEGAGRLRVAEDEVVIVDATNGDTIFVPPAADQVTGLVNWLIKFFNRKSISEPGSSLDPEFIHPVVKASIIHFMIGYIHPFVDGNGRLARALFYWYLLSNGYWLTEYLAISRVILKKRNQYYDAFQHTENDENDLTYFIKFQTEVLGQAYQELKSYLSRQAEKQRGAVLDLVKEKGITQRQALLFAKMQEDKGIWTVHQVETVLVVSHQTARNDLNALYEKGLTDKIALDKKTQGWTVRSQFPKIV